VPLKNLSARSGDRVDILAVVDKVGDTSTVNKRSNNEQLTKRDVSLVDRSGTEVTLTLWGEQADEFDESCVGKVIAMKGASVKEFLGGFTLSAPFAAGNTKMNLQSSETNALYNWYRNIRPSTDLTSISTMSGGNFDTEIRLIGMAVQHNFSQGNIRGLYFFIKGTVSSIKTENITYQACVTDGCKKKVTLENGSYTCSKCGAKSDKYNPVLILQVEVNDFSGSVWLSLFDDRAEKLLGHKAAHLVELKDENAQEYDAVFDKIRFADYIFRVRMHETEFNEEKRPRWDVMDIKPVQPEVYKRALETCIKGMERM